MEATAQDQSAHTSRCGSSEGATGGNEGFPITGSGGPLVVMKFGGSSLATAENISRVVDTVSAELPSRPLVVLSAIGKTTDKLIALGTAALEQKGASIDQLHQFHVELIKGLGLSPEDVPAVWEIEEEISRLLTGISLIQEISARTQDLLMSYGERLSVRIVSTYMERIRKIPTRFFDAWDVGLRTTGGSGSSESLKTPVEVLESSYDEIGKAFAPLTLSYIFTPVVTGFIAKDEKGTVTTLGRSGSDFSAAIFGAAVNASEVQIWTDVNGVLTADPRVVKGAKSVQRISFDQAAELAYFGAKVLHPKTILPAMRNNIPVRVKNSYNPCHPGTVVLQTAYSPDGTPESLTREGEAVTAITYQRNITVVDVNSSRMLGAHGFLARLFSVCDQLNISIDVVATSEVSVSLSLEQNTPESKIETLRERLSAFSTTAVRRGKALISVVGNLHQRCNEVVAQICLALSTIGVSIQLISFGSSKVNFTFCVDDSEAHRAVQAIHDALFFAPLSLTSSTRGESPV
ncbi:aspartate kinase [Cystoisospora suis]|uniref:Aspartokinase n=1 Tax=Cystoisospora suis TaxID=483139 RepID=A0A2C6KQQ0_9APIC|nr:aspartate kinase [Cystoisospora suis]